MTVVTTDQGLFTVVEDAQAILRTRGVFRQVRIYSRRDQFYAAARGGFVRLAGGAMTSVPDVACVEIIDPLNLVTLKGRP